MISTDRGRVEYAELRPEVEGAATVLVVHGSPGGVDQGIAMGRFLVEQGLRVIAPSRPGYLGTPLESGRTPAEQAELHAALLDRLGVERVGVLCWSGGGPSAYRFAVQHPDRVRAVVALAAVSSPFAFHDEQLDEKLIMGTGAGRKLLQLMAKATPEKLIAATIAAEGTRTHLAFFINPAAPPLRERAYALLRGHR